MNIFHLFNHYFQLILSEEQNKMKFRKQYSIFHALFSADRQYEPRPTLSPDHLILLIDPRLASLPLESLNLFRHVQIGGISRDFSIQSVYYRLNSTIGLDENAAQADGKLSVCYLK